MTSQVMAAMTRRPHSPVMKKLVPALVFLPFAAFSSFVIAEHGYFGFLTLSFREPWALQMLLDLTIALFLFGTWMRRDARQHGIPALPYLVALPFAGSLAALVYLLHRAMKGARAKRPAFPATDAKAA
jgi:protein-S-isoprenylcysteine O-methyltransferase Ste14